MCCAVRAAAHKRCTVPPVSASRQEEFLRGAPCRYKKHFGTAARWRYCVEVFGSVGNPAFYLNDSEGAMGFPILLFQ